MGADLIMSINKMEATKEEAYENARHLVAEERLQNTITFLEDCAVYVEQYETSDEVLALLIDSIDLVYGSQTRRDCSMFYTDDSVFYITAGMSWGDSPTDAYEAFNICECLGLTLKQPLGE